MLVVQSERKRLNELEALLLLSLWQHSDVAQERAQRMRLNPRAIGAIVAPMEKDAVITEALALPERGRAEVAARLLESLGGPGVAMTEAEVLEEARRRSEEMDDDPANTVTHEEFVQGYRARQK